MLFGPATRVDFVAKFVASGADIGVLDLEDAVAHADKDAARSAITDARPGESDLGTMQLFVRVNSIESEYFDLDLAAASAAAAHGVVVPKLESAEAVAEVRAALDSHDMADVLLCAGIESAAGVHRAVEVAAAQVDQVYFGAEDFITDMGGVRTESNSEVLYARSHVALAARLAGIPALDQVVVNYRDDARFESEALAARALGYRGKLCIHPSQVKLALKAFTPSAEEVSWAERLIAAVESADGAGVVSFEGTMVDAPILLRAKSLVAQRPTS